MSTLAALVSPVSVGAEPPAMPSPCNSAESCVKDLEAFTPNHWLSNGYGDWMPARVARVGGAAAVPALRQLLTESKDERVRAAAARTLEFLGSAARPAIDDLVRAAKDGNDDALLALVKIAPDVALPIATSRVSESSRARFALLKLGAPGLRELARLLNGNAGALSVFLDALDHEPDAIKALAPEILKAISDRKDTDERLALAAMLAHDGPAKSRLQLRAALRDLRESRNRRIREATALTLAPAGDPGGVRRIGRQIGTADQHWFQYYGTYQSICEIGAAAAGLVPRLSAVVRSDDWEKQALAAQALGCIGARSAVTALVGTLRGPSFPVIRTAVEALEKIPSPEAEGPLTELARAYWHPAVRARAERALAAIRGQKLAPLPEPSIPPREEFACYGENLPPAATRTVVVERDRPGSLPAALGTIDELTSYLPVDGGWLATANKGEWGGGLYFLPAAAKRPVKIVSGNFHYVAERPSGLVAVEGLWHLASNHGSLWRVERRGNGYSAAPWMELPGTPNSVWQTAGDTLVVATEVGPIAIDPAGHLRTGDCHSLDDETRELLQLLLDDERVVAAFTSRDAPVPLRVGLWRLFDNADGLTFRGQPVVPRREWPSGIESGTYLEIINIKFDVVAGKAQVRFAYPNLALSGRASFKRTAGRWTLDALRLKPLTEV